MLLWGNLYNSINYLKNNNRGGLKNDWCLSIHTAQW